MQERRIALVIPAVYYKPRRLARYLNDILSFCASAGALVSAVVDEERCTTTVYVDSYALPDAFAWQRGMAVRRVASFVELVQALAGIVPASVFSEIPEPPPVVAVAPEEPEILPAPKESNVA